MKNTYFIVKNEHETMLYVYKEILSQIKKYIPAYLNWKSVKWNSNGAASLYFGSDPNPADPRT